jgi:deazaflavin-dependent oxidoreductase (nitroreductase family)
MFTAWGRLLATNACLVTIVAVLSADRQQPVTTSSDQKPSWLMNHVMNPAVSTLVRLGALRQRIQLLSVVGRTSGKARVTPVTLVDVEGTTYLVAPQGQVSWVRNIRVAGRGELRHGRQTRPFTVTEVPVSERAAILKQYVQENNVARYFAVASADAPLSDFAAQAGRHPVFAVSFTGANDRRR